MDDIETIKKCCSNMDLANPEKYLSVLRDINGLESFRKMYEEYIDFDDIDLGEICYCSSCIDCSKMEYCERCGGELYLLRCRFQEFLENN